MILLYSELFKPNAQQLFLPVESITTVSQCFDVITEIINNLTDEEKRYSPIPFFGSVKYVFTPRVLRTRTEHKLVVGQALKLQDANQFTEKNLGMILSIMRQGYVLDADLLLFFIENGLNFSCGSGSYARDMEWLENLRVLKEKELLTDFNAMVLVHYNQDPAPNG